MSLKAFHLVFVAACLILGVSCGLWGFDDWRSSGETTSLVLGIFGTALALAVIPYSFWFLRKMKKVSYL